MHSSKLDINRTSSHEIHPRTPVEAWDEYVARRVQAYKGRIDLNRKMWAVWSKEGGRLGWKAVVLSNSFPIPPALPARLPRDIELRAIEMGLL